MIIEPLRASDRESPAFDVAAGAAAWYGSDGRPVAYSFVRGEECWFRLVGLASYVFPLNAADGVLRCEAVPDPGAEWTEVVDHYYRSLSVIAMEAYGFETLHGSALRTPAGALVLTAPSRMGKTTLALALARRGHELVADDAVVVEVSPAADPGRPALRTLPFVPRAREETAAIFGLPVRARVQEPGVRVRLGPPVPLAAFVVLARSRDEEGGEVSLERLPPTQAYTALLARAYFHAPHEATRDRQTVAAYLRLVSRLPVYLFRYPSSLDRLEEPVSVLDALVAELAPAPEPVGRGAKP